MGMTSRYSGPVSVDLGDGGRINGEASFRMIAARFGPRSYLGWRGTLCLQSGFSLYHHLGTAVTIRFPDGHCAPGCIDGFQLQGTREIYDLHGDGAPPFAMTP